MHFPKKYVAYLTCVLIYSVTKCVFEDVLNTAVL